MRRIIGCIPALFVVFALSNATSLAQPANDAFANAWTLTGASVTTNGSTQLASKEVGEPNHAGNTGGRSVWFNWTAPKSSQIRIDTIGSAFNTLLAVYTGNAVNALSFVAANNNGPNIGTASLVEFQATQGTTYRIAIDANRNFGTPGGGPYILNLRTLASIAITSPANGAVFSAGDAIPIDVAADVPAPPVARMDFYRNGFLVDSDTTEPFSTVLQNAPAGSNTLVAVATDSAGQTWNSSPVTILVRNVGVTLVEPVDGSYYLAASTIPVAAVISPVPSGTITSVDFLVDGVKFAEDASAPFTAVLTNPTPGSRRITAVGRTDTGATYNSQAVNIGVAETVTPYGSVWKYLDNGSDQGTNWTSRDFNDSTWASGPAELGYGDGDEATLVQSGPQGAFFTTTYFRRSFVMTNVESFFFLVITLERDDAGVVYLNGREVLRSPNLPAFPTPILYNTLATGNGIEDSIDQVGIEASALVSGTNVIAVEIHQQSPTSSDISFNLEMIAVPSIIRNLTPTVDFISPSPNEQFLAPASIPIEVTASDEDGTVAKVEFHVDGVKLGEASQSPYAFEWFNPPVGLHSIRAVAYDDQGASGETTVDIAVYDAAGRPLVQLTSPASGSVFDGPTNLTLTAVASSPFGITQVRFFNKSTNIGTDMTAPYGMVWTNATFGTNQVTAVATDAVGVSSTSAVVTLVVNAPPPNLFRPTLAQVIPSGEEPVATLTSIQVIFSERVIGVDASDLLINGVPATGVTGTSSNYTFTFPQPAYGEVQMTWSSAAAIYDVGYPPFPFDEGEPESRRTFLLIDNQPPAVLARNPAANATVTNLTQVTVTFSEPVANVNAADLLINNLPAVGLNGGGSNYTFSFPQPPNGPVNISWALGHGIADLAPSPNAFNANAAGATWSYTLDARTILVQSNANWTLLRGLAEASSPIDAWRNPSFDDTAWQPAAAPFYFGDPYNSVANPGTFLNDMQAGAYTTIYLRRRFMVENSAAITNLLLAAQSDDGFAAWINGVEVARFNAPAGNIPYNGVATATANEPNNSGAPYLNYVLPNPASYLHDGENVLAVHALNQSTTSSDFGFNAQLYTYLADLGAIAPRIASITPAAGSVFQLTSVTVRFTEPVAGVSASDLLVNGSPATGLSSTTNTTYTFSFPQPPFGTVNLTWAGDSGIADFDNPPKPFDVAAPGAMFSYTLINPSAPTVASQTPLPGATINQLTQLTVSFSEAVVGVDAGDLLVSGVPAVSVTGGPVTYTFTLNQPAYGSVSIGWAASAGITDQETPANAFDPDRAINRWAYTLIDQTPPVIQARTPAPGTQVLNLTSVTVDFSEPVTGVNAADLLINGVPAASVSGNGNGSSWTFNFPQPNATVIEVTWANAHGIRDLAPVPNSFDATAPGTTWSYLTVDNLAPQVASLIPPAGATVRTLTQITLNFTEPVTGVGTNDLLVNNRPALGVSGSGAGPYTFNFLPASNGLVQVRWSTGHGIADLAAPPNAFAGGEWTYTLDPNASFAGAVLINEIMFNPLGGLVTDEWIELLNVSPSPVNLAGWRITRGVNFTFPEVSIPVGGYLVVAADVDAFKSKYPDVNSVVGGWTGRLANSEETIAIETAEGEAVNEVHYATEGDWGVRERGHGAEIVESISLLGNTATITIFGHGYSGNDRIMLSGADQPEYNGIFTISSVGVSTFNITVPGTPAPPTGNIISRHVIDEGASGWSWFNAADGFGSSMELVNPLLPNTEGQNWRAGIGLSGTPGRANSVRLTNVAPLILDVTHAPAIPKSTDPVAITARVRDELSNGVTSVQLYYRNHTGTSPGAFASVAMLDNGLSGDGVAGDHLYGAVLPAEANGTVMEFYVQASDSSALVRTWPAPAWETNNTTGQFANAYYQVDDEVIPNTMPVLRVILSGTERAIFAGTSRQSDAEHNVTFVSVDGVDTSVHYLGGVRIRGAGSRNRDVPNNRVNLPNDNLWNGMSALNLNSQFVHAQLMGAAVARKSGLPASDAHVIQYRINGINPSRQRTPTPGQQQGDGYGTFILVQPVNGDLADDLFPEDGDGNVYRASTGNHNADLSYRGTNPSSYLERGYMKTANQTENDWTDLMNLTASFSLLNDADFRDAVRTNLNVTLWMRYFAVGSLINFGETSLFNGRGDDYAMYRGLFDPRFVLIGHDFDTIFGQGDTTGGYAVSTGSSPFIMISPPATGGNAPNVPLLRRLMTNEHFVPFFFEELLRLADGPFHPSQLNPLFDQMLTGWGPSSTTISDMKNYAAARRSSVLSQIPQTLTVGHALTTVSNGLPYTTAPTLTLFGASHAARTRQVLVNGTAAARSAWEARWTNTVVLQPGINRVLVQSLDSNNVEFARATLEVWFDDSTLTSASGTVASDTVWSALAGPYQVTSTLTINPGATLTIQAGATVFLNAGANIVVANGGRLLAEGTDTARIWIGPVPGVANWGGITINGAVGSPESRLAYVHITGNNGTAISVEDGTAFLDHLTFGNAGQRYLDLDRASFVVQDCVFPAITGSFEPAHGTGGIKAGGRGIFRRNYFGRVRGYNDALDFTGGNRPGPILQVINNVFMGSDDDLLDLDSTDAWVEGNIFLHTHRNNSPDSASAVSGGADNADTSQITIVGNLFYDVDHAANAKQGNFYTMVNNTIVRQTRVGSQDTNTAVVILADMNEQGVFTTQGAGIYLEGNIISDAENLTRHVTTALVTFSNNIIHQLTGPAWTGPGGGNVNADPLLKQIPPFSETTNYSSWAQAQVMWDHFSLLPGSPASGRGPNGRDQGGVVGLGVSLSGEPLDATPAGSLTLTVAYNQAGNGVPVAGFPNGSGHTHYRWRLDGGAWSSETPISSPIALNGLSAGPHFVEVSGKNDAGFYQDDPVFGPDAVPTVSRTWVVNPTASPLRITEVLAANGGSFNHAGTTPDAIELYNQSDSAFDLSGVRLTDDRGTPDKFIFPSGASIAARSYLVVLADNPNGTPGYHLGFSLSQEGEGVYLYAAATKGGALLDSIEFGMQLTDRSIGRWEGGSWTLTQPTLGTANLPARLGDASALRINEWLASGTTPFDTDFVELYNPGALPVALGGLYLTDELIGNPTRHRVPALSFLDGFGYQRFLADGDPAAGADHLNFSLGAQAGEIGLLWPDGTVIDCIYYQPQRLNVSEGRTPNGSSTIAFFTTPTPGAPNPLITINPEGGALVINEVLANNASLAENGRTPDWVELYNGTTSTLNLGDLSLTDDTLRPRRFVFPGGVTLLPGARLRVICDPGTTASGPLVNTNFALRSSGGGVYLFDSIAQGGSLLSSIVYGLQTPDLSIGRVPDGTTNWVLNQPTPDSANLAITSLGDPSRLRVNEWLADPEPGEDDWIEIYNGSPLPVALGGLHLTDDLNNRLKHAIAPLSFLGNGTNAFQRFIADSNPGAGADHVSFSLRAAGEAVGISGATGNLIDGYAFGQQAQGVSQGRFPDGSTNVITFPGTQSPGESNWRWLAQVAISEVLTHSDLPLEDAIELQNLTDAPVDVGGWWLSDDNGTLRKYQIPAPTVIPAHGFTVIYETVFTNDVTAPVPFALSSQGDEVVLSAFANGQLTGYRTRVDFGPQFNGVSFGRYLTSDGRAEFVAMNNRTFGVDDPASVEEFRGGTGRTNALPRVGPVVISEIMYHPPDQGTNDNVADEFIELRNITTAPVALFDPAFPTNVWRIRDAVDFDFPPNTTIPASGYLILVSFDPVNNPTALEAFRTRYNLSASVPVVGPWAGRLANDSDDIELRRPDAPNPSSVPYVLVERVRYADVAPWPADADGTGMSLQRVDDTGFGNDPGNWVAGSPSPGPQSSDLDSDDDGLPDTWEIQYGLDPLNAMDAGLDADGDGLTNLDEYEMQTNPRDARSGVAFDSIAMAEPGVSVRLIFTAAANKAYHIEFSSGLPGGWQTVHTAAAQPVMRQVEVVLPGTGNKGFYRLRLGEAQALRIDSIQPVGAGQVQLNFTVPANRSCGILYRQTLGGAGGNWSSATNIPAATVERSLQITLPAPGNGGFYRLQSP